MESLALDSAALLANGCPIPLLGLGVWKMREGKETEDAVMWALEAGYRHIDTAKLYANERSVGNAVRRFVNESNVSREDIFITTKLWPTDFFNPEAGFNRSFDELDLEYIDLYLIHWPMPVMPKNIWQTFEKKFKQGSVRAIGVSNYGMSEIEKLLEYATVAPMVNQVEFNPTNHDLGLLEFCKEKNIVVEAYSPLGRGSLVRNEIVVDIAEEYNKTPAQILIRWALQHGTVVLPKSSNQERIKQNSEVFDFEISEVDMDQLNSLQ
jgi:diketogulonate reductase-like aldo/keto reductase